MNTRTAIGVGVGIATGIVGLGAYAFVAAHRKSEHDAAPGSGPTPSPSPGPSPHIVAGPDGMRVDDMVDYYFDQYDHDRDPERTINISPFQAPGGSDERVTGDVGDMHTMVGFFKKADANGDDKVTWDELRTAIAAYDTTGTNGSNPKAPAMGDGFLGAKELKEFRAGAIEHYGAPAGYGYDRGVPQIVDGANNEPFFESLPAYRAQS